MRSTILLLIIVIINLSCVSQKFEIDERMMNIAKIFMKDPKLIYHLKESFPENYDTNYTSYRLTDSNRVNKLIQFIVSDFNLNNESVIIRQMIYQQEDFDNNFKTKIHVDVKNVLGFCLWKGNYGVDFIFVIVDNNYFICYVGKSMKVTL